jgi:acetolactate synthase regulatory subunit
MPLDLQIEFRATETSSPLLRILSACARRRCTVTAVHFDQVDGERQRVTLRVADEAPADRLVHWLGNLLDVVAVDCPTLAPPHPVEHRDDAPRQPDETREAGT